MFNLKSKKSLVLALLMSGAITSSMVMADGKREPNFERMADRLELSSEQKNEFMSVMGAQYEKHKEVREQMRSQKEKMKEQHRKETLSSLEGVLSEEQMTKFKEQMEKREKKFKGKKMKYKDCHK